MQVPTAKPAKPKILKNQPSSVYVRNKENDPLSLFPSWRALIMKKKLKNNSCNLADKNAADFQQLEQSNSC